jgi:hypothetical protein
MDCPDPSYDMRRKRRGRRRRRGVVSSRPVVGRR